MLEQFEIVARTPNERTQARTRWSEPAFVAEYGEEGLYGVVSVNASVPPSSRSPNTSSVEMWCRRLSLFRTASSSANVPTRLLCTNAEGSRSELSLCDSAAKWMTVSLAATSSSISDCSQMSPSTNSMPSGRFARLPA